MVCTAGTADWLRNNYSIVISGDDGTREFEFGFIDKWNMVNAVILVWWRYLKYLQRRTIISKEWHHLTEYGNNNLTDTLE